MNKKIILVILIIIGISISIIFLQDWYSQPESLRKIMFSCTTGINPSALMLPTYDNGTHTIDLNSCVWIPNKHYTTGSGEYQDISSMSCEEVRERHNSERPYQNKENRLFAQVRIDTCNFVNEFDVHNDPFVKNCVPTDDKVVLMTIGIENKTHTFDLRNCEWNLK